LASSDFRVLTGIDEARQLCGQSVGWLSDRTALRQDRAYDRLVAAMKRGKPRVDLAVAAEAVAATEITNVRVIEVGCGGGYYSEIFAHLLQGKVQYSGADYSEATIRRARRRYPSLPFCVGDATGLPFADATFDIAFNGAALMHILEYETAIREAARVSSQYCIFHSVPISKGHRTTYLHKYAYGAPVIEIVFCEEELISMCKSLGLHLIRRWTGLPYDVSHVTGSRSWAETFLFVRANRGPMRPAQ
jgi:ubiquinone/menaquinone biosynthesis C-methylase UbiE